MTLPEVLGRHFPLISDWMLISHGMWSGADQREPYVGRRLFVLIADDGGACASLAVSTELAATSWAQGIAYRRLRALLVAPAPVVGDADPHTLAHQQGKAGA